MPLWFDLINYNKEKKTFNKKNIKIPGVRQSESDPLYLQVAAFNDRLMDCFYSFIFIDALFYF